MRAEKYLAGVTPLVAIVGRPNVGKSTLFNRLMGRRKAIVHDTPGVTRDRHYGESEINSIRVRLVDTGGFQPGETEGMLPLMREQAQIAIDEADLILFICNGRDGATVADEEIADVLRRTDKPVFCVANKCDSEMIDAEAMSLYSLGFPQVLPIAAAHNRGMLDLLDAVASELAERGATVGAIEDRGSPFIEDAEVAFDETDEIKPVRGGVVDRIRVAFVGRPNVGKSTLVNQLLGQTRVITADMPGTTRDAIDIDFEWEGAKFTLVDTAGLRRKRSVHQAIEAYSVSQAVRAMERCHVVVIVLDATQEIADQDAKIAALALDRGRACVIAINKWDAIEKDTKTVKAYEMTLREELPFMAHVPAVTISAKTGQRVEKLWSTVQRVFENFNRKIGTGELNRWLAKLQIDHQPPTHRGRSLRIYYGAQLSLRPPQLVFLVNSLAAISPAYERFLIAQLRGTWDLEGAPVRLRLRKKSSKKKVGQKFQSERGATRETPELEYDDAFDGRELADHELEGDEEWRNPEASHPFADDDDFE